ncbi:protein-disulfide reductase DsbD domain-containing protein [Halodurantibacterium flavum]|uniref:Protein-disulfide reductase DsbD domain-containing protein n=1 Tax=Halodurantibacterium flavum TaxID=1382802 RepID=A0ABW4S5K0_9RHOB
MMKRILVSAALVAFPLAAPAQVPGDLVSGQMRTGWRTATGTHMAALDLRLQEGWKTYWRAPGDAGIPPHFDWAGSENLGSVAFHWPVPDVFDQNGLRSVGYHDALVLPMEVTPLDPTKPVLLRAKVDLGICEAICMPVSLRFEALLPDRGGPDPEIARALDQQPRPAAAAGLTSARCDVEPIRDGLRLTAALAVPSLGPDETAVIEVADGGVWVSETILARSGGALTAKADLVAESGAPFALNRSDIRITLLSGGRGYELEGCPG